MNVFGLVVRAFSNLSFRARLIISNAVLASVVIISIAYYTLARADAGDKFLAGQLTQNVLDSVESELNGRSSLYANDLNGFFVSMTGDMETVRDTLEAALSVTAGATGPDDLRELTQLPQGSWDNPNTDAGSIFVSARDEIPNSILSEIMVARQIDFIAPAILDRNDDALAVYFGSVLGETLYYPNIDLAAILPADFDVSQRPWFLNAAPEQNTTSAIVWSEPYQDAALNGLV
ncbi:MAG: hypothetical protein Q7J80_13175, partial [Anaerolineales bacterium]|nr:hypothetical protein [Anaerolineales bacterium]